jgi:hypothetical protein
MWMQKSVHTLREPAYCGVLVIDRADRIQGSPHYGGGVGGRNTLSASEIERVE